ncbi:HK97 gp10 family phage protein [Salinicoccus sp. HZC-1]|uniref:HK97 gp10 family phage protein n=1 Tax=Salinicoccus sp. HZC-1 TaxID=3385497 RepID=UPI00398B0132
MFTFNVDGIEQTLADLESIFSEQNLQKIKDKALEEGATFMRNKIHAAQLKTKDTGAMASEVTFSDPQTIDGERVVTIHWKGPDNRYRVVHLVENGFYDRSGKFIKPAGYGQIENVLASNQARYIQIVQNSIARQIGA